MTICDGFCRRGKIFEEGSCGQQEIKLEEKTSRDAD